MTFSLTVSFEELAQNGPLRAAIISAESLSFMAAREGAPLCASKVASLAAIFLLAIL
jgi:hypothetical protein